jgi:hypothetical protein
MLELNVAMDVADVVKNLYTVQKLQSDVNYLLDTEIV